MSTFDVLMSEYEYAFGSTQFGAKSTDLIHALAMKLRSEEEARALVAFVYQNRDRMHFKTKPTGRDLEQALNQLRQDRGDMPTTQQCPECDGTGTVMVAARRDGGRWLLGWHPDARMVTTPCACPKGRALWRDGAPEVNYRDAQDWLNEQRAEAQANGVMLITWLTRQENVTLREKRVRIQAEAEEKLKQGDALAQRGGTCPVTGLETPPGHLSRVEPYPGQSPAESLGGDCPQGQAGKGQPEDAGRQPSPVQPELPIYNEEIPDEEPQPDVGEDGRVYAETDEALLAPARDADGLTAAEARAMAQAALSPPDERDANPDSIVF